VVEFRLLGPLEVVVNGEVRTLPADAERAVLEVLLLNAGRVMSTNALVDALWGEQLPANAANALQGRISRLRRALTTAGLPETLVITRRPGYLVDVDPEQVDVHRFVRLVSDARGLADNGSSAEAIRLYAQARAMWRGDPLAEFSRQEWSRVEAGRLTELLLAATEEQFELELRAGRHADLVAELEALTARHPLRERLHRQLMLALYRSGRQADALAAFQRIRRTLGAELGLDPSDELRRLEQAILQQDPTLGAPVREPAPSAANTNLPTRLTSFIGRDAELQDVAELLRAGRLVTLTGPGGAGKTSLAVEAASRVLDQFTGGVWLVRLAGVAEPARMPRAVADALGVPEGPGPVEDQLIGFLRDRRALVVLDNCEHLVDACATLVEQLLGSCRLLRLLATSREPLAVPGEVQFAVPPLAVPPPDANPGQLPAYEAVQLFLDRAHGALPSFTLDPHVAPHVAEICRRLDGIPLAIELAASRVKTFPVSEIAGRLTDRFRFLTTGPRTAEARQRTLRATVEWSHQLLSEPERVLFRRLSAFRGGWSLEAAEQVCAGAGIDRADVVGLMTGLVDRSLVITDHRTGVRFRMLETLRHYAQERLVEAEEDRRIAAAHARYVAGVTEQAEPQLRGPDQGRWLRWLQEERDNIDTALSWCHDHVDDDPDLALRLVAALGWFWYFASHQHGRHDVSAVLAAATHGTPEARALALQAHAVVARPRSCIVHPHAHCADSARESVDIFTTLGETHRAALSRTLLAVEAISGTGVDDARVVLAGANDEFIRIGDAWGRALVLFVETELHGARGALDAAIETAGRALTYFRALGDHWGTSAVQYHLGLALHRAGRFDAALEVYQTALSEGRHVGMANTVQYLLANMGHAALALGDLDRAQRHFTEARTAARQLGAADSPLARLGEGFLARQRGDLGTARHHFADAVRLLTEPEAGDWAAAAITGLGFVAELSGELDEALQHHLRAWQVATGIGQAGAGSAAAAVEGLAGVAAARADGYTAAALLGSARRWRAEHHRPASPLERVDIDRADQRARDLLPADEYEAIAASPLAPAELVARLASTRPGSSPTLP
jgi:predicted ATPase/DNA-binding SARP family transcriptional activator/tetratricopeptide (TPR) repeat protein